MSDAAAGEPTREAVTDTFLHELPSIAGQGAALIFDDFHLVDESPDVRQIARELVTRVPELMQAARGTQVLLEIASTDEISLVKLSRRYRAQAGGGALDGYGLASREAPQAPHFSATGTRFRVEGDRVVLPDEVLALLGVAPGDDVGVLPF